MSATQTLVRHLREQLSAAGYPAFFVGDDNTKNSPPPKEHRGTWFLLPTAIRFGFLDLAEARRTQGFMLVGMWSGAGMLVADQAAKGASAVFQKLTRTALPAGILSLSIPTDDAPLFCSNGLTEVYIPITVVLTEVTQ